MEVALKVRYLKWALQQLVTRSESLQRTTVFHGVHSPASRSAAPVYIFTPGGAERRSRSPPLSAKYSPWINKSFKTVVCGPERRQTCCLLWSDEARTGGDGSMSRHGPKPLVLQGDTAKNNPNKITFMEK